MAKLIFQVLSKILFVTYFCIKKHIRCMFDILVAIICILYSAHVTIVSFSVTCIRDRDKTRNTLAYLQTLCD